MQEQFKVYPNNSCYEVGDKGTIRYNGKVIRDQKRTTNIFMSTGSISVQELIEQTFSAIPVKEVVKVKTAKKQVATWVHGNTGRKHTTEAKSKMRTNRQTKQVVINGVSYKSITDASQALKVDRSTIRRSLNRKALT